MGEVKNLNNNEAVAKLKELAEDIRVCMFCTELGKVPFSTRPMALQEVDESGNLWFISSAESNKNFEIKADEKVQLLFSKLSDSHFINVFGSAYIYTDKNTIEDKWTPMAKAWFEDGKDDPNVTIIRVAPEDVYYWDTKYGKIVYLIKAAVSAIIGKDVDSSQEGNLNV